MRETLSGSLAAYLAAKIDARHPKIDDRDRLRSYQSDPVGFARDILGVTLWGRQAELVQSAACSFRIACCSGRRTGKSTSCAVLAIWCYCTFDRARVVIMAPTVKQVRDIVWKEIRRLVRNAKIAIPGASSIGTLPHTGLTHPETDAEIKGYTARDAESMQGIAAPTVMYILDEASGIDDFVVEAAEGNCAGGHSWLIMVGNPTRAAGAFYDAHHAKRKTEANPDGFDCFVISSKETPKCTGVGLTPELAASGLASPKWIAQMIRDHGEDSWFVKVHIDGDFVAAEEGRIFPYGLLEVAEARWEETNATGRLWIGVDPAGPGVEGDEWAFAARRGRKILEVRTYRGLSPEQGLAHLFDLIAAHRGDSTQTPVVNLDSEGETGTRVKQIWRAHEDAHLEAFRLIAIHGSRPAQHQWQIYKTLADELYANARTWMTAGGAIVSRKKLREDLHAPEWVPVAGGKLRLTSKDERRVILGRSPDEGDAVTLACWEALSVREDDAGLPRAARPSATVYETHEEREQIFDPYEAEKAWR